MIESPSRPGFRLGGLLGAIATVIVALGWAPGAWAQPSTTPRLPSASAPAASAPAAQPNLVPFQPGVRINWTDRQVEVDATVILRQGGIELFACSPRTREHESIICIQARPLHVYQALGLIGLTPGHPIRFDPGSGEVQTPTGDPVEVRVRYRLDGKTKIEPIERWMQLRRFDHQAGVEPTRQPLNELPWVFAGSFPVEDDAIAADFEGTVVAVVNFSSALIALPEFHSDSNAELWLEPDPPHIPPLNTPCTLLLRAGPLRLDLDAAGRLRYLGRTVTFGAAARTVADFTAGSPQRRVHIAVQPGCPQHCQRTLLEVLAGLGVRAEAIDLTPPPPATPEPDPRGLAQWLGQLVRPAEIGRTATHVAEGQARELLSDIRDRGQRWQTRREQLAQGAAELIRDLRTLIAAPQRPITTCPE